MRKIILTLAVTLVTVGVGATTPAIARTGHNGMNMTQVSGGSIDTAAHGPTASFVATLTGAQEVPTAGGPAVGDPDGSAQALVQVKDDRVTFALKWQGIGAPTLGHIHQGDKGANGDVKVPLFTSAMPDTVDSAAGQTSVTDESLAKQLRTNPVGFYVNLHSKEFPGGAVRGQLKPVKYQVNPLGIVAGGSELALMDGDQEVRVEGKKVGDPDGHAITFVHAHGRAVDYSMAWVNIDSPIMGHIHQGVFGKNGDVKVPLFASPVPSGIFAISGTSQKQDRAVVKQIHDSPFGFYANLHTAEFPDGAVRGQLFGRETGGDDEEQNAGDGDSTKTTPRQGQSVLFDNPGSFSEDNPSQGVTGSGCVDVFRSGVASAVQTDQPVKVWSAKGCTGKSLVIKGDDTDLSSVDFDNKISSVFFGDV
ncbi:CHRD domain-containing protein [Streptomyces hyaluromycini]|uniref:CHRD domain-containing protein n=1 Tax=Streptomyces hyaluromycini TaxID=1377993 RepID=UPI001237DAF9|nr:CHRD domain-containing protein [Streptomyces hyaluromycini]